jgi:hypothetical protein
MKKLILLVMLLLPFSALSTPRCTTGIIKNVKYNDDNTMSITINNISLYTSRWNLQQFLFNAYILQTNVTIYTTSCYDGGGFSEIQFH